LKPGYTILREKINGFRGGVEKKYQKQSIAVPDTFIAFQENFWSV
jgi:hypothetical protein